MRATHLSRSGLGLTQGTNLICKQIQFHKVISQSRALTLNQQKSNLKFGKRKGRGGYGIKIKWLPTIHIALKHKQ